MRDLSLVIFSPSRNFDATLESCDVALRRERVERIDSLADRVMEARPDAVLVSLERDAQAVFEAVEKFLTPKPLLFFHGPADSALILRAMRAGAYEYIAPGPDAQEQLVTAIRRAARETEPAHSRRCSLIALIGSKGGVGTTFTACQLAGVLARQGGRTALVDGHFRQGDVALYFDLSPRYDLASLATRNEPIDATYLHTAMVSHSSGVAVLAAPKSLEDAEAVDVACIDGVIGLLRSEFDWVVWDTPYDFDDRSLRVLDQANPIVLVTTPDLAALNRMRIQLDVLARLGRREEDIRIVLNRSESTAAVSTRDAREFLKRPVDARIPNDYRRASACVNEGRTLSETAPRSSIDVAMNELATLAHTWCDRPLPAPRKRGLLDRLRGA